jgi:hypothetical protein
MERRRKKGSARTQKLSSKTNWASAIHLWGLLKSLENAIEASNF